VLVGGGASLGLAALLIVARPAAARSEPFVPSSDQQVLERLPQRWGERAERPPAAVLTAPRDPQLAEQRAQDDIREYQRTSDPRFLGRAEAQLAAFWEASDAPVPIVVLRAKLRASNHDFEPALRDLDLALDREPRHAQALLERATIATVLGRYAAARVDCQRLAPLVSELYWLGCTAAIRGVTGDASAAADELTRALARAGNISPAERGWAESLIGELLLRSGDAPRAERSLQSALEKMPGDAYTLSTLSDLLLEQGRPAEVVVLLAKLERVDGLLLRLAIAEKRSKSPGERAHVRELGERFADARLRGSDVHRREEARFELELGGDVKHALELSLANFKVQREPWDVRLVLEASLATAEPSRAREALEFAQSSGLEDPAIRRLMRAVSEVAR